MKHAGYIYDELKQAAPFLATLDKTNVYTVPPNYFSDVELTILKRTSREEFPGLPAPETAFTVPQGYFENLAAHILKNVKDSGLQDVAGELRKISPVLYSVPKDNVFTVPSGYFQALPLATLDALKPRAKVVAMEKRSMVWNCAAAAVITGVMAVTALWSGNISPAEIESVAGKEPVPLNLNNALQYTTEQQLNKAIADLSDADIVNYLETTGSNADDEALASGIPEKDLPDELDYLTDENTLQIFLRKSSMETQN